MPLTIEPRGRRRLKGIREPIAMFAVQPPGAAPSRSRRLPVSMLERRPLLAAFAALAGLAAVATVVLAITLLTNTRKPSPARDRPPGNSAAAIGPSAIPTSTPSDPGPFPNAAEQKLLGRLDSSIASFCRRAETTEYPLMPMGPRPNGKPAPSVRIPVVAGLRCAPVGAGPDVILLRQVTPKFKEPNLSGAFDTATVDTYFFRRAGAANALPGDCAKDEATYMNWSFGPLRGKLLCVATPGTARIEWTYDGEDLITAAERDDGDGVALYQWWLDTGRSMLH